MSLISSLNTLEKSVFWCFGYTAVGKRRTEDVVKALLGQKMEMPRFGSCTGLQRFGQAVVRVQSITYRTFVHLQTEKRSFALGTLLLGFLRSLSVLRVLNNAGEESSVFFCLFVCLNERPSLPSFLFVRAKEATCGYDK